MAFIKITISQTRQRSMLKSFGPKTPTLPLVLKPTLLKVIFKILLINYFFYEYILLAVYSNYQWGPFENWPVGRAVMRSSLEREVWGSILRPVKSDTVLPTARHRCDISLKRAALPRRNDAEMGPAHSLHASAYYSEYNERFDLIWLFFWRKLPKCDLAFTEKYTISIRIQ